MPEGVAKPIPTVNYTDVRVDGCMGGDDGGRGILYMHGEILSRQKLISSHTVLLIHYYTTVNNTILSSQGGEGCSVAVRCCEK